MAKLYVAEFSKLAAVGTQAFQGPFQNAPVVATPPVAEQVVAIGVGSTESAPFHDDTTIVRVETDAICSISFGKDGANIATANKMRMVAGQTEYFGVARGTTISVIANT